MGLSDMIYRLYGRNLQRQLDPARRPGHVAVILDGNRRWARGFGAPTASGHQAGAEKAQEFLGWCDELDINVVTLFLLSTDNLRRPEDELVPLLGIIEGLTEFVPVSSTAHILLAGQARALFAQVGTLLAINLVITFMIPFISWTGHLGGLAVGAAIGYLLAPRVTAATLGGIWRAPSGERLQRDTPLLLRAAVYLGVAGILLAGTVYSVGRFG
jgi:hypothetical protein